MSRPGRRAAGGADGAAMGLGIAAGLLALSVLADSALEHDRGEYKNPAMFTPLVLASATLGAAIAPSSERRRNWIFGAAVAAGLGGLGFHLFDILKRPGRMNWLNLFYAAPVGAPAALSLAGALGLMSDSIRRGGHRIAGAAASRAAAGLAAIGLVGTVAEAALLHFRGSFQNPAMWAPVTLPPVGAALLAQAALDPQAKPRPLTRAWLGATALLGLIGAGFHIFGVHRAMGGWKNWRQNMIDGPPIPAPPAFTALSIAGLAALSLRDAGARAAA